MKPLIVIASSSLLLLSLFACKRGNISGKGTDLGTLKWETIDRNSTYSDPSVASELAAVDIGSSFQADLHLTFPSKKTSETAQTAFLDSVSIWLQKRLIPESDNLGKTPEETMNKFIDMRLEGFKADFEEAKKEGYNLEILAGFVNTIAVSDSITYNDQNLFSILTTTKEYTGGAHGLQTSRAMSFDFAKEIILTPSTLFKEESITQVNDLILKELLKQNNATNGEELEELGFFNYGEAKASDNLLLTDEGVTFIYNPYEIAAYFVGTVTVTLPFSEIKDLLDKDYSFLSK